MTGTRTSQPMAFLPNPDWYVKGACRTAPDPDVFVPDKRASGGEAKAICCDCRVKVQCRAYALANPELRGVWGGLTDRERRDIHRAQAKAVTAP